VSATGEPRFDLEVGTRYPLEQKWLAGMRISSQNETKAKE